MKQSKEYKEARKVITRFYKNMRWRDYLDRILYRMINIDVGLQCSSLTEEEATKLVEDIKTTVWRSLF